MDKLEQFKNAGWTEWKGGEMPVPEGTLIRIRDRLGAEHTCLAGKKWAKINHWRHTVKWRHTDNCSVIIAYQILEIGKTVEGDPIVIGAEYKTRVGEVYRIVAEKEHSTYSIVAININTLSIACFTREGKWSINMNHDLMRLAHKQSDKIKVKDLELTPKQYEGLQKLLEGEWWGLSYQK